MYYFRKRGLKWSTMCHISTEKSWWGDHDETSCLPIRVDHVKVKDEHVPLIYPEIMGEKENHPQKCPEQSMLWTYFTITGHLLPGMLQDCTMNTAVYFGLKESVTCLFKCCHKWVYTYRNVSILCHGMKNYSPKMPQNFALFSTSLPKTSSSSCLNNFSILRKFRPSICGLFMQK